MSGFIRRKFTLDILAKEISDEITLQFFNGSGQEIALFDTNGKPVNGAYRYSVSAYLEDLNSTAGANTNLKTLIQACENYGIAAQLQFGVAPEGTTVPDAVKDVTFNDVKSFEPKYSNTLPDGITKNTCSLV